MQMRPVPTYEQFRAHAVFVPEYADFVIYEKQLRVLLSDLELLWGGASLGIGDVNILLHAGSSLPGFTAAIAGPGVSCVGSRNPAKGALTFEGVVLLCKQLQERAARTRNKFQAAASSLSYGDGKTDHVTRQTTEDQPARASASVQELLADHGGGSPARRSQTLQPEQGVLVTDPAMLGLSDDSSRDVPELQQTTVTQSWWLQEPGRSPRRPMSADSRPHTNANIKGASSNHQHVAVRPSTATAASRQLSNSWHPSGSHVSTATNHWIRPGLQPTVFTPRVLHEVMRVPTCDIPHVARLLAGIKAEHTSGHQPHLILSGVKEAVAAWEQAIVDKATKKNKSRKEAASVDVAAVGNPAGLPPEGAAWLLAMSGSAALKQGRYESADKLLAAAMEHLSHIHEPSQHHYHGGILLLQGLLQHYQEHYEAAAEMFKQTAESGLSAARCSQDPVIQRNAAAAVNNQGSALIHLGDRVAAVKCFKQAVALLRHPTFNGSVSISHELAQSSTASGHNSAHVTKLATSKKPAQTAEEVPVQPSGYEKTVSTQGDSNPQSAARKLRPASAKPTGLPAVQPVGLDAPAAHVAMHNLQGAVRYAFGRGGAVTMSAAFAQHAPAVPQEKCSLPRSLNMLGAFQSRPHTAPSCSAQATKTTLSSCTPGKPGTMEPFWVASHEHANAWSEHRGGLAEFLQHAITYKPPAAPATIPAYAKRVTPKEMENATKGKGGGKTGSKTSKQTDSKGGKDKKGSKAQAAKGFSITYTGDYYNPPTYSVANVTAEPPKAKKTKAAGLKKK